MNDSNSKTASGKDASSSGFVVDGFDHDDNVALVVDTGQQTLAFGYSPEILKRLRDGEIDQYFDIAPWTPNEFEEVLVDVNVEIHRDLEERAEGMYPDSIRVHEGVGVIPCNPSNTVVIRDKRGDEPFDVLISNATEDEEFNDESLSGAVQMYGH